MGIISWIIIGSLAGWIARKITGDNAPIGRLRNIMTGVIGALLGGFIMSLIGHTGVTGLNLGSLLVATGGAVLLLKLTKRSKKQ